MVRTHLVIILLMFFLSIAMTHTQNDPANMMRELRLGALKKKAPEFGLPPSLDNGAVYCVVVDWPVDDQIVSVVSLSDGNASLYTTSTFGIIGGFAHERVRAAAIRLVEAGDALRRNATPTTDYSYPKPNKIRFYMVTYGGVRVIDADRASVEGGSDKTSELFARAQDVITELRLTRPRQGSDNQQGRLD
jgi:hypothetical protein